MLNTTTVADISRIADALERIAVVLEEILKDVSAPLLPDRTEKTEDEPTASNT
jgi:hypothetical protein